MTTLLEKVWDNTKDSSGGETTFGGAGSSSFYQDYAAQIQGPFFDFLIDTQAMTQTNTTTTICRHLLRLADERGVLLNLKNFNLSDNSEPPPQTPAPTAPTATTSKSKPAAAGKDAVSRHKKGFPCKGCNNLYADMIFAEFCRRNGCLDTKANQMRGEQVGKKRRARAGTPTNDAVLDAALVEGGCSGDEMIIAWVKRQLRRARHQVMLTSAASAAPPPLSLSLPLSANATATTDLPYQHRPEPHPLTPA
jgi:hypothetical protein